MGLVQPLCAIRFYIESSFRRFFLFDSMSRFYINVPYAIYYDFYFLPPKKLFFFVSSGVDLSIVSFFKKRSPNFRRSL